MKTWEFRNIFHDLNDIEKQVLLLTDTVPDFVIIRKLADIRMKLLTGYADYNSKGSPLIDYEDSKNKSSKVSLNESAPKNTDKALQYKYCVEVPDRLGGNKLYTFSSLDEAETCAAQANGLAGYTDKSPNLIRVVKKLIGE